MYIIERKINHVWSEIERAANYHSANAIGQRLADKIGESVRIYDPAYFQTFTINPTDNQVG